MTEQIDIADLREKAEAQQRAASRMMEIGEGVGGLGRLHPEMLADFQAWISMTNDEHADTVLDLLDEIERLRAVTPEQVEVAARTDWGRNNGHPWEEASDAEQAVYLSDARAALEAARQAGGDQPPQVVECPHWAPGSITLRSGCTACSAEAARQAGGDTANE